MTMESEQELRFVHHLFRRIKDELTGRSVAEIVGDGPRDRLHAGVLLPLEPDLPTAELTEGSRLPNSFLDNSEQMHVGRSQAPKFDSESAMSMDFQIRLPDGVERFVMRIRPHFSVYYAVFPTRIEVLTNQGRDISEEEIEEAASEDSTYLTDPADQETEPDVGLTKN